MEKWKMEKKERLALNRKSRKKISCNRVLVLLVATLSHYEILTRVEEGTWCLIRLRH